MFRVCSSFGNRLRNASKASDSGRFSQKLSRDRQLLTYTYRELAPKSNRHDIPVEDSTSTQLF